MKKRFAIAALALMTGSLLACAGTKTKTVPYPPSFETEPKMDLLDAGVVADADIKLDGHLEDAWAAGDAKTVWLYDAVDGSLAYPVILRALYSESHVYISAQWPDLTPDDMPKRYMWNEGGLAYEATDKAEDMLAIAFELRGDLQVSMLTTKAYEADVWHWKAGRGNASGYADDKRNIVSPTQIAGQRSHRFDLYDGSECWIARPSDAGDAPYKKRSAPREFTSNKFEAAYDQVKATGSRGDVMASGKHDGKKFWTLELKRKLNTGNDDDVIFRERIDTPMTIAIWNDQRDLQHAYSGMLHLRLKGPLTAKE